ncbi:MAG TPA: hypothetical protein ENJ77_00690, partial [Candidatus Moranbacteria bacterium]|nr:hypothetical protein [Candidatus Moranbacteria bacterium]
RFHPNVKRAVEEYGSDKVAAVYRHFPLDQIHPNARREAMAAECVADQKGDGAFWSYVDKIFAAKDPKNSADGKPKSLTVEDLTAMAESLGVARSDFSACLTGEKFADKVETDKKDAISAGGRGTPYTVVIAPNGENFVLSGARSYGDLSRIVDQALTLRK